MILASRVWRKCKISRNCHRNEAFVLDGERKKWVGLLCLHINGISVDGSDCRGLNSVSLDALTEHICQIWQSKNNVDWQLQILHVGFLHVTMGASGKITRTIPYPSAIIIFFPLATASQLNTMQLKAGGLNWKSRAAITLEVCLIALCGKYTAVKMMAELEKRCKQTNQKKQVISLRFSTNLAGGSCNVPILGSAGPRGSSTQSRTLNGSLGHVSQYLWAAWHACVIQEEIPLIQEKS